MKGLWPFGMDYSKPALTPTLSRLRERGFERPPCHPATRYVSRRFLLPHAGEGGAERRMRELWPFGWIVQSLPSPQPLSRMRERGFERPPCHPATRYVSRCFLLPHPGEGGAERRMRELWPFGWIVQSLPSPQPLSRMRERALSGPACHPATRYVSRCFLLPHPGEGGAECRMRELWPFGWIVQSLPSPQPLSRMRESGLEQLQATAAFTSSQ